MPPQSWTCSSKTFSEIPSGRWVSAVNRVALWIDGWQTYDPSVRKCIDPKLRMESLKRFTRNTRTNDKIYLRCPIQLYNLFWKLGTKVIQMCEWKVQCDVQNFQVILFIKMVNIILISMCRFITGNIKQSLYLNISNEKRYNNLLNY